MRILFYTPGFSDQKGGGVIQFSEWHTHYLSKEGFDVKVLTMYGNFKGTPPEANKWLEIQQLRVKYIKSLLVHRFPIEVFGHIFKDMRKVDVVHVNGFFYLGSVFVAFAALMLKKPLVWSIHGELNRLAITNRNEFFKRVYFFIVKTLILKRKKDIVFHATSNSEEMQIKGVFQQIDPPRIVNIPVMMPLDSSRVKSKDAKHILFLGRLHKIKGLELLIEALGESNLFIDSKYELIIAGSGQPAYERYLELLAAKKGLDNKIVFVGRVEGELKQDLLAQTRFMILPSFSENFGIVVIEALQYGIPVIASTGTPWDSLAKHNAGKWVSNKPKELQMSIESLLAIGEDEYSELSNNARSLAFKSFNITTGIRLWSKLYKELVLWKN